MDSDQQVSKMEFSTERIKKRIETLEMELIHDKHLDGWTKTGIEEELSELNLLLKNFDSLAIIYNKYFK